MKDSCVGETVPIEVVLHVLLPYLAITAYSTRESLLVEVRLAPRTSAVVWSPCGIAVQEDSCLDQLRARRRPTPRGKTQHAPPHRCTEGVDLR